MTVWKGRWGNWVVGIGERDIDGLDCEGHKKVERSGQDTRREHHGEGLNLYEENDVKVWGLERGWKVCVIV